MQPPFIGQTYIDVTFLTDRLPTGDEKHVASNRAVSYGGNAVTAAFRCAKLSATPELMTSIADDWLGECFLTWWQNTKFLSIRGLFASSLSFIMPNRGKRAIARSRDDDYLRTFPRLDLTDCRGLHC
jgi:sugar/nucleoside kinase (ribokinase family)